MMPVIEVTLTQGRSPERIRALISALTEATVTAIEAPQQSIRVIVREIPKEHFAAGDVTIAERGQANG